MANPPLLIIDTKRSCTASSTSHDIERQASQTSPCSERNSVIYSTSHEGVESSSASQSSELDSRSPLPEDDLCQSIGNNLTDEVTLSSLQSRLDKIYKHLNDKGCCNHCITDANTDRDKAVGKSATFKRVDWVLDPETKEFILKSTKSNKIPPVEEHAFYVRRHFNRRGEFDSRYIEIKAPLLRDALRRIVGDVKGMDLFTEEPVVDSDLLFLYNHDIVSFYRTLEKDNPAGAGGTKQNQTEVNLQVNQLKCLVSYFEEDYKEIAEKIESMLSRGVITFELLWALWKPGDFIISSVYGKNDDYRVFLLDSACKRNSFLSGQGYCIDGTYLDYDGRGFVYGSTDVVIKEFHGVHKITSLPCYPLKYCIDQENMRKSLIERGDKFFSLCGVHYKSYAGTAYYRKKDDVIKYNMQPSRVMVDSATFRRINGNYSYGSNGAQAGGIHKPDAHGGRNHSAGKKCEPLQEWTDDDRLITCPVVLGFSFSDKLWLELAVSSITEISWNNNAWATLVMPLQSKNMIQALVTARKSRRSDAVDDAIQGKGKGLVSVLHGPPGTGKTLTAESISELLQCPLYAVSAGELGANARTLEADLERILDISHTWGAILLLDEADVFLETRNMHDVHRNSLVSVFLRQLEHFQGILFLTTNRVETFDDAFRSRIHIALRYEPLDAGARKSVFRTFLKIASSSGAVGMQEFTNDDYITLAKYDLNGREIKNAVGCALDLAANGCEELSMKHIQQVLEVHAKFRRDLKGGTGFEDALRSYV